MLTPYDFGAVGDGLADDTQAVNEFLAYAADHVVLDAKFLGTFRVTDTVRFRPSDPEQPFFATDDMRLRATLIVDRPAHNPGPGVEIAGVKGAVFSGKLTIRGVTGSRWPEGRHMTHGVVYGDHVRHALFDWLYVEGALLWGVQKVGKGKDAVEEIGSNSRVHHRLVYCHDCGLSARDGASKAWAGRYMAHTDNADKHGRERSRVTLAASVPPHIEDAGRSVLLIRGNVYGIAEVLDGTHLEVFPRIPRDVAPGDEVLFAIGGGIYQDSVDFSLWCYDMVDVAWCGIGWYDANSYGNAVQLMHAKKTTVAGLIGRFPDGWTHGGFIGQLYVEGGTPVRGFPTWGDTSFTFGNTKVTNPDDFYRIRANRGEEYRRDRFPGVVHKEDREE
ncbi:hypothetical protein SAMN02745148_01396 [Modicisalibacter ilicicola DSM 19980]|uniref:Pectate lyase superfamily protein n=1 Tax=Modicisalibacter ilicicola DSM 19980 TaxID=1121942 RepID=A0A1M4XBI3_9GAMM|nr:hypothetical protein [Halomonas ilicicola]SHE90656.1 hypothetical protein SAMN02745148_01396 [Halomonas ilicicola DSM 19980]